MEKDDASGMAHTLWRKYDSSSGRWTTPDPYGGSMTLSDPQSFNRYTYVNNDPVNLTDPSGLMAGLGYRYRGADLSWSDVSNSFWGRPDMSTAGRRQVGAAHIARGMLQHDILRNSRIAHDSSDANAAEGSVTVTYVLSAQQSAGRILIIVGDPGIGEHNVGSNFDRVAETKRQELEALGNVVIVLRASSDTDLARALISNGTLNGVEYIGHASYYALHVGEQRGDHTNLTQSDLSTLSNANLSSNAYVKLNACYAGSGGAETIAAGIATQLQRTTLAFDGGTVFSGSERSRVTERTRSGQEIPPRAGPLYLIEDRGTTFRRFTP
jgi:RHS repeat-associated protein